MLKPNYSAPIVALCGLILHGCSNDSGPHNNDQPNPVTTTEIAWTSYGVPHITAENYEDLGEGLGYLIAQNRYCNLTERIVTVRSERSMYLGAGESNFNINSDFAYLHLDTYKTAKSQFQALDNRNQNLMTGFAAGFNYAVAQQHQYWDDCAFQLDSISAFDVYAANLSINYWPFISKYWQDIGKAESGESSSLSNIVKKPVSLEEESRGSNGWAIGKAMSKHGRGMVLSNTHLPHDARFAWYEVHMTIPDELDVYGGILPGLVTPALGFNKTFAWTHTWTAATAGSIYALKTVDNDLYKYRYDDEIRTLTKHDYQIKVMQPDKTMMERNRTLYKSHFGPILSFDFNGQVVAIKDAPSQKTNYPDLWLNLAKAQSVEGAVDVIMQGYRTGSQNIIMADDQGDIFYADLAAVPHLSEQAWQAIIASPELSEYAGLLLDGSSSLFEWDSWVPFDQVPHRHDTRYVQNANDAAWLVNVMEPITDYSPLYGGDQYAQSARTQLSLTLLEEFREANKALSLDDFQHVMIDKRLYLAELLTDDLVVRCQAYPEVQLESQLVDISKACEVLAAWDRKANANSVGTQIFREYAIQRAVYIEETGCTSQCWQTAFDPEYPLSTPRGLPSLTEPTQDIHLYGLAQAVLNLELAGVALDSKVNQYQRLVKGDASHQIAGGMGNITGSFSTINVRSMPDTQYHSYSGLKKGGYDIGVGDGFIYLLEFTESGPNATSVLLYSQSNNPQSPHYFDQAPLIDSDAYKPVRFSKQSIIEDPNYRILTLSIE